MPEIIKPEYVCYCAKVTKDDIRKAIEDGAMSVEEVIESTGAMKNSDCAKNNPKGTCCYSDISEVFRKEASYNERQFIKSR